MIDGLELWPIVLYILTAIFCLGSSATFHWMYVRNEWLMKILNRLDLASISVLIYGSSASILFYVFYCERLYFYIYFTILTVACIVIFSISMQDWIYQPHMAAFRGNMYVGLGLFSALAMVHVVIQQ